MGQLLHMHGDPHEETQQLLPWYVTDSLDPAERMRVEAHLAACETCRADMAAEQRLSALIRTTLPVDEAPITIPDVERFGWRAAMRRPVRVAWFVAAQAAVVLLCVGIALTHRQSAPPPVGSAYRTLGNAAATRPGNLLVLFVPGTPESSARRTLMTAKPERIEGPTVAGAFLLVVPAASRAERAVSLATQPNVSAVQAIDQPAS